MEFESRELDGEREVVAVLEGLGGAFEEAAGLLGFVGDLVEVVGVVLPDRGGLGAEFLEEGFEEGFCFLFRGFRLADWMYIKGREKGVTNIVLSGLDVDAGESLADGLLVVVGAGALEDVFDSLFRAVGDFQVEIGDPDVELGGVLADVDGLEGPFGDFSGLGELADLHLEGHVGDPELPVVRLTKEKTLVITGRLRAVSIKLGSPIYLDLGLLALLLLGRLF